MAAGVELTMENGSAVTVMLTGSVTSTPWLCA